MNWVSELHTDIEKILKEDMKKFNKLFYSNEKVKIYKIISSVVKSKQIIGEKPAEPVIGKISYPDIQVMATKSL